MNIYVPWGLIAIRFALYKFYDYNRKNRLRKEQKREEMNNRRKELLEQFFHPKKKSETNNM